MAHFIFEVANLPHYASALPALSADRQALLSKLNVELVEKAIQGLIADTQTTQLPDEAALASLKEALESSTSHNEAAWLDVFDAITALRASSERVDVLFSLTRLRSLLLGARERLKSELEFIELEEAQLGKS